MNNPFLSDRNIFSKVINPLKKKPEVDKRQSLPTQTNKSESLAAKSNDNNLSSNYQTLKEKPRLSANLNNNQAIQPIKPISKMSFGKTQEMDNRLSFNNNFAIPYKDQVQYQPKTANQYQKVQNYNFSSNESNNFLKNDYKSLSLEQNVQLTSPNQEYKFQEYRKANNFNECSPIQQQASQKLQDSQFLNIDAIGEDLNKFLASSKNQEEICKLLGLNMQPKNTQQIQPNEKPYQIKKVERVSAPRQQPNVGSIFTKQKKEVVEQQYYTPQYPKNAEQYHKEDKQYVPTFNYAGLDQQNEVLSREEEYIPRFAGIPDVKKTQRNQNERQSIQVFNYSQNNVTKTQPTLQDLINEEMNALSWNGKYRTFLTSAEKIVTYKYKLQHL